jgi:type III restriction enzyme
VKPDRDALEIKFPRVEGYRVELPEERLKAVFNENSLLEINPILVGPSITNNQGIIGESVELNVKHLEGMRQSTILFELTKRLLYTKYRDANEEPKLHLFGQLKRIVKQWIDRGYLRCTGNTFPAQVLYLEIADMACNRIKDAIESVPDNGDRPIKAILDAYNPIGSTAHVRFNTSKQPLWDTAPNKSHVNWVVYDSQWEAEFCRVVEAHPRVRSYVKNQGLGFEVPYLYGSTQRKYIPDFILQIDDGRDDLLNLIVEIKGFRGEDAKDKANTMKTYWIPGVNSLGKFGRWAFAEFTSVFEIDSDFNKLIDKLIK